MFDSALDRLRPEEEDRLEARDREDRISEYAERVPQTVTRRYRDLPERISENRPAAASTAPGMTGRQSRCQSI